MCKSFDEGNIFCFFKPENGTKRISKFKGSNSTCFHHDQNFSWSFSIDRIVKVSILYSIVYFLPTHPCGRVSYSDINPYTL